MTASRIFVYEYLSGAGQGADADRELLDAGVAMRDALVAELAALPGLDLAYGCAPGVAPAPRGTALRPRAGESALDFVRREALRHDRVWVVAPESGGVLERMAMRVDAARWIGCEPEAIRLGASKSATLARLAARGLATPLAFEAAADAWVVKPDDGAGTLDTRRHASRAAAEADLQQRQVRGLPATLEPWVDGEALSLSLLCRDGDAELLAINRQRIAVDADGLLRDQGVRIACIGRGDVLAAPLAALARAVAQAIPGLRGYVGVDLVWHPVRGPVAIEVNPRLTCSFVGLSAALGRSIAAEVLALHEEAVDVAG